MNPPDATYTPDTYRYIWTEEGVEIVCDRLQESHGDLICEMSVKGIFPFASLLREAKFNLSAARTRTEWANTFRQRPGQEQIDWYAIIEQACTLSLRHWREGAPFIDLTLVEPREDDAYLLKPYVIDGAVSGVFGDGGTGKSLFALAVAVSVATGENLVGGYPSRLEPVLYLDWEWDADAHAERLQALGRAYGLDLPTDVIFYRREIASIIESAPAIRRFVAMERIGMVVIDSLGFARGGEPESAELTIKTFSALNSFGVPVLFVDHIAKHSTDRQYSFGSVYTRNSARLMWRMDAPDQDTQAQKQLGLVNTKWNRRFQKTRGLLLTIEADEVDRLVSARFDDCDPPLASLGRLGIKDAVLGLLKANPEGMMLKDMRTALEIEGLKVSENVLAATLSRKGNRGLFGYAAGKWRLLGAEEDAAESSVNGTLTPTNAVNAAGPVSHEEPLL